MERLHPKRSYLSLLAAALIAAVAGSSPRPAEASDLEALRERAQGVADEVTALELELAGLTSERNDLQAKIESAGADIAVFEERRLRAGREYDEVLDEFVEDAVALYKSGSPGASVAILMSARDLGDVEMLSRAAGSLADEATRSLDELESRLDEAALAQAGIDSRKQELLERERELEALASEIAVSLSERRKTLGRLHAEIGALEEAARNAALSTPVTGAFAELLGPTGPSTGIPDELIRTGVTFEGTASWYGPGFEGNYTANGDVFDSSLYTAASKELPLPSYLYVEFEGRGVVVLVNDRGPYVGDRVLDLSHASAEAIGISGLGWVKAEILVRDRTASQG